MPKLPKIPPLTGAADSEERKLPVEPLANMKTTTHTPIRPMNLMLVRKFIRKAPFLTPRILTAARITIREIATTLVWRPDRLDEIGQVLGGESDDQSGDRAGFDDQEQGPPEEEGDDGPVGFAEIDIDAAGLGIDRGQLGDGQGAEETQDTSHDPDGQHQLRCPNGLGDIGGVDEDPGADHGSDDDPDDAEQAEDPAQLGSRRDWSMGIYFYLFHGFNIYIWKPG